MIRSVTRWCVFGIVACLFADGAGAQEAARVADRVSARPVLAAAAFAPVTSTRPAAAATNAPVPARSTHGELRGTVHDADGQPLRGAVVSAHRLTPVFALSDGNGRFTFRSLAPGTYLIRVHLDGYAAPRGRYVQVNAGRSESWEFSMERLATPDAPVVLSAAVGGSAAADPAPEQPADEADDDELAWRLRHLKRGVLRDAGYAGLVDERSAPLETLGRGAPARFAASLFDDIDGQVNLLTRTSFDRTEDLFSLDGDSPRPVAYIAVVAPTAGGEWAVRGSMAQGDVSSWILAGSFTRRGPASHKYEVGASYAQQQYRGGTVEALAAVSEQSRQAGELYGSDTWAITPHVSVGMGGKYATYGYMTDRALLSGRMGAVFTLSETDPLRVSVSVAHRELAPGAEEFLPPDSGMWLPPERTFSEISRGPFRPQRVNHLEIAGERDIPGGLVVGVRAFQQEIDDQLLTVFGLGGHSDALGHYLVGNAGDFASHGWGFSVTRATAGGTAASVAYTQVDVDPHALDAASITLLSMVTPSLIRERERIHDITASLQSRVAATATRVYVVYKLNNAYAAAEAEAPTAAARFEVQLNQEMPFLDFTGARWEMLLGVRNLFRSNLYDGSIYDELLVVRPPKRVMGGLTVRF